jgi:hypothetical protein
MGKVFRGCRPTKKGRLRAVDTLPPRPECLREGVFGHKSFPHNVTDRVERIERAILRALGERRGLFSELKRLRLERERALHEAFFEAGYGHGIEARRAVVHGCVSPGHNRGN